MLVVVVNKKEFVGKVDGLCVFVEKGLLKKINNFFWRLSKREEEEEEV